MRKLPIIGRIQVGGCAKQVAVMLNDDELATWYQESKMPVGRSGEKDKGFVNE